MMHKMKNIICLMTIAIGSVSFAHSNVKSDSPYCIALRGNGELKPAHWGALAQTVEVFGIPSAMAGGSSASISTFLVESILLNSELSQNPKDRARDVAFLIKSFEGFVYSYTDRPEYQRFFEVLRAVHGVNSEKSVLGRLSDLILEKSTAELILSYRDVKTVLKDVIDSEVFYGPQVQSFHRAFSNYFSGIRSVFTKDKWRALKAEHEKLKLSLAVFGKFDAKNDQTIFVRDGIINFASLAKIFGIMANFYSLRGATEETHNLMQSLLFTCAHESEGLGWREIALKKPACQTLLNETVRSYARAHNEANPRLAEKVGAHLSALVSTSVVENQSVTNLLVARKNYQDGQTKNVGFDIASENLKFGYWGMSTDLNRISTFIQTHADAEEVQIDKTQRFLSLGEASWEDVLKLSPAEPGLSPMIPFEIGGKELVSLGGWSDLHPVPILKAKGCAKVVYVTRKGGESIFAQGIAKRLLGFANLPWTELDPDDSDSNQTQALNNRGRTGDVDKDWSKMFNLANPASSLSVSLKLADAVVCTDWNAFDVTKDFRKLIDEAYAAPIYFKHEMDLLSLKSPLRIGLSDNVMVYRHSKSGSVLSDQGYPKYTGCIPITH